MCLLLPPSSMLNRFIGSPSTQHPYLYGIAHFCDILTTPQHPVVCAEQALNIPTKINKGCVEITGDVHLIKEGEKVGGSEATLLSKLGIRPFSYGLVLLKVRLPSPCLAGT